MYYQCNLMGMGHADVTDPIHICYKEGYFIMSVVTYKCSFALEN
jgi:hypothetical protein